MLIILYLVFLCSNFLFIKSEDNIIINIELGQNCTTDFNNYIFTDGKNVNLVVEAGALNINHGWWYVNSSTRANNLTSKSKMENNDKPILHSSVVEKSMEGTWEFKFYYHKNLTNPEQDKRSPKIIYEGDSYTEAVCRTNVKIAPDPTALPTSKSNKTFVIIASVVGAILSTTVVGQAAYIVYLRAKAQKLITLNTHNNLSKKTESAPNDTARYCSNPGQKMMKVAAPVDNGSRDSVIYEAPNIEISGNGRIAMQAPQPPAITTIPRTPRSGYNIRNGPEAMQTNFQRPKLEHEISVVNRPKLELPTEGHPHHGHPHQGHPHPGHPHNNMLQDFYEEMGPEENTYEPPPIVNSMPPARLTMPPKKVPTGNLLDVKENTLKMRQGNKPLVTPKPQQLRPNIMTANEFEEALRRRNNDSTLKPNPGHMSPIQQEQAIRRRPNGDSQTNELEEALRRRNNVMQVPIVSIPDPSSRGSPNTRPPPAVKTKPRGPPVHQPVQEEIYYNDNQASSDEEWTYEPLKPLNSYEKNIYNV